MDVNIRIAGEAGQGMQTTGELLVRALAGAGAHIFATQVYMSRIRGGLNSFDVRISDGELYGARRKADILVALNSQALEYLRGEVAEKGVALFDGEGRDGVYGIEFSKTAKEIAGTDMMANTVAAGAVFRILGYDVSKLISHLSVEFQKKGADVVAKNAACARRGEELAAAAGAPRIMGPATGEPKGSVYLGCDAIGLGAATAGLKFIAAYPMTPSTSTWTYLASVADKYGIFVEQAEDEIAAVNMACGAAYAGVPAMTTTAGGGFALMVEGLSLSGMLEVPIVIGIFMRPAPATGLPTRTAQEDLKFAINAGHGEFARAVFAPGTIPEAFEITRRAFDTAHRFQTPVIVLADQFFVDARKNVPPLDGRYRPIDRRIVENAPADYMRYRLTEDGVSPRAIPGGDGFVVVDSDEHGEDGHITEDLSLRKKFVEKRLKKYEGLAREALAPSWHGPREAGHVLITWGSTYGPAREAVDLLNAAGGSAAMMHFSQVWPVNAQAARAMLSEHPRRRVTSVEGNATGQFASILRERGVMGECELMSKYDGLAFTGEEIAERARNG